MTKYWSYIKPYLPYFIIGPILMLTEVFGEVLLPKLMSMIIDFGISQHSVPYIVNIGLMMVGVAVVMMAGGVGGCFFATKASVSFATDLRKDIFHKVQGFSFKNIDTFSTGSLVTRLTNDITQVQNVIRMSLIMLLRAPGMLIGAFLMAVHINARLALVIAVVIPLLSITIIFLLKTAFPRFDAMQKKLDDLNTRIQENLTNVRVVKSFVRNGFEEKKFFMANKDLKQATLHALKIVVFTMPVMMLAMNITMLAVVWFGGQYVIGGEMPVGDLTAFTTYIVQILMSLMMLSMVFLQSSRAMASSRRILEVLNTTVDLTDEGADQGLRVTEGKIEFADVCFKYHETDHEDILSHISFTARPGEIVGIIGSTGAGKTSLVQLIPRLYDVASGQVLVDGRDVREYPLGSLRDGVGMVLQKNVLFSGSILDNLRWGNKDATMEEIIEAAKMAQAHEFISSFPDGYETQLGQGGVNVSGGQKQRLCIARALLKKPKILILDDSTSAVDTATEAKIRASFSTALERTTKLIIAQRISSVIEADHILVLEEGKLVGSGTHEQLLAGNEQYQEIYYSQMEREVSA